MVAASCLTAVSAAYSAELPPPGGRQDDFDARFQKLLNSSPDLAPSGFDAYFNDAVALLRPPHPGLDPGEHDLLVSLLMADFVLQRIKDRETAGPAWLSFAAQETARRLKATGDAREEEILRELDAAIATAQAQTGGVTPEKLAVSERKLDALYAASPQSPVLGVVEGRHLEMLVSLDPVAAKTRMRRLVDNPNARVATLAKGRLEILKSRTEVMEMKFTAVDGREVDLARLRGKVVLVDFWATWCHPCVAELPNVKQVYAAYHDRGFEVVGIALENGKLTTKDTPEEAAAKLGKARKILVDFAAQNGLPWPQYFDGKWWKNDISTKYAINGIPAMFLIDRNGLLVSTDARGPKLEAEVRRLLKL